MSELKTTKNTNSVIEFITSIENEIKQEDCCTLLKILENITAHPACMWGTSIIGFSEYHYKSERSTQEGDWPLIGFSPRKLNISIYLMPGVNNYANALKDLGKFTTSKGSCLYIKKLSDVDVPTLTTVLTLDYKDAKKNYKINYLGASPRGIH